MDFKDYYNEDELKELIESGKVEKIKAIYKTYQSITCIPVLVEKSFFTKQKGDCIPLINFNDIKTGYKLKYEFILDRNYTSKAYIINDSVIKREV